MLSKWAGDEGGGAGAGRAGGAEMVVLVPSIPTDIPMEITFNASFIHT